MPVPLLILSDHPNSVSGLGRITRDLAARIHEHMGEDFKVATIGPNGTYSSKLPFPQYTVKSEGWMLPELPQVWRDHAGDATDGIVLSIWDLSRLAWLVDPEQCPPGELQQFIAHHPFKRWGYLPLDAEGVGGKLSFGLARVSEKFDRLLAYTEFGAKIVDRTLPRVPKCECLPHGICTKEFSPVPRAREQFNAMLGQSVDKDTLLLGVVATNQARKDWPLAFDITSRLIRHGINTKLWCHLDTFNRYWDIGALIKDFEIDAHVIPTAGQMTNDQLACSYSACDVTLGIGSEGWGFPIAESLACGTPCITGDYAGGAELVPSFMRVKPLMYRYDGAFNSKRPVFDADKWVAAILANRGTESELAEEFHWDNLFPRWAEWLKKGIE